MSGLPHSSLPLAPNLPMQQDAASIFHPVIAEVPASEPAFGVIVASIWRHRWVMAGWVAFFMTLVGVIIFRIEPIYRADALVALATRQIQFSELSAVVSNPVNPLDGSVARSEVAILDSDELARRVVQDLGLVDEVRLAAGPSRLQRLATAVASLADAIRGVLPGLAARLDVAAAAITPPPPTAAERLNAAVEQYRRNLSVFTDGRSYIVNVSFEAPDPALAARIVNRHVELYIQAQRQSKDQALISATHWVNKEVGDLAERLRASEAAVQAYRERHRLFAPGGTPISQQQLADINGELARARADLAQREARLRQAKDARASGALTEVVTSDTISRLREQEVITSRVVAEAAGDLGPHHPKLEALRAELADVQDAISREKGKIVGSLAGEAASAREREAELRRIVAELEDQMGAREREEAGARALEREANALRALYEALLSRQKQVATQVGIQQPDAQVASAASLPLHPSFPDRKLLLAVGLVGALSSAAGIALLLERRRNGFGSLDTVEAVTGLRGIVALPGVRRRSGDRAMVLPDQVATRPRSAAAEAVRTLRQLLSMRNRSLPHVLAVTSCLPGEGKTSVALALARSLAASGHNVLLIEADLRRRTLARRLGNGRRGTAGIVGVLEGRVPIDAAIFRDPATPLRILAAEHEAEAPQDLLASDRFARVITAASEEYDHVIVDTPPVGAVSDALLVARVVEVTLLVVRAESTPRDCVAATVKAFCEAGLPLAGAVLNATEPQRAGLVGYATYRQQAAVRSYLRD